MLGTSDEDWKKLYHEWYDKEKNNVLKLRPVINRMRTNLEPDSLYIQYYKNGTNNIVYQCCTDEHANEYAMKTLKDEDMNDEWLEDSNIALFSEACIHIFLYNLYKKTKRKNRIICPIKMGLYSKTGKKCVYIAMKRFDKPLFKFISDKFVDRNIFDTLALEIKDELDYMNKKWDFVHCDLHTGNIGIVRSKNNIEWYLFDFGMSEFCYDGQRIKSYQGEPFFEKTATFNESFDKRILFNSWKDYDKGTSLPKKYFNKQLINMKDTHVYEWIEGMPIKFIKKNKFNVTCGKFIKTSEKGVQVKISLPNNMVKSHEGNLLEFYHIDGKYIFYGKKNNYNIYIKMTVNEEDIEPNFEHPHVCYYFYYLE